MIKRVVIVLVVIIILLLLINYVVEPYTNVEGQCTKCRYNTHEVPLENNLKKNLITAMLDSTNAFYPNVQCGGYKTRSDCIIAAFKNKETVNGFQASVVCNTCA